MHEILWTETEVYDEDDNHEWSTHLKWFNELDSKVDILPIFL